LLFDVALVVGHMNPKPETIRVFIAGSSGAGKSTRAWHMFCQPFPRRLLLDQTGEWSVVSDVTVYTVAEAVNAMRIFANKGTWTICLALDPGELPLLVHYLIPVPDIKRSPVLLLGGMVLLIDEVDLVAPFGPPPEHIRTLMRRSRHAGLSVISTTQRPENVCREVTALSTHAIAMRLVEPRGKDYMQRIMGWSREDVDAWVLWTRQHPHGGVIKNFLTGESQGLPNVGPPVRDWTRQLSLLSASPASAHSAGPGMPASHRPTSGDGRAAAGVPLHPEEPEEEEEEPEERPHVRPLSR
jgi:hypothetical protein